MRYVRIVKARYIEGRSDGLSDTIGHRRRLAVVYVEMAMLLVLVLSVVGARGCYWNSPCQYQLYGSKTPYDTVRGDIRDYPTPAECEAVSLWSINRHGNRNPGTSVTVGMKEVALMKDQILDNYYAGKTQLCAQDAENFRKWTWNSTLETSPSFLTGTGYEELFDLGKRIREKYLHLLQGIPEEYYFRPTNEQRTVTSCAAFVHGFTNDTELNVTVEEARVNDDVVRPYEFCDRYQNEVKGGQILAYQLDSYFRTPEYIAIQSAVQHRLGITNLTAAHIFSIYELCRFPRSWAANLQSPWCSVFTAADLLVLEYYDDVRHYHRNGYGSWVNERIGRLPMKDLYENFEAFPKGYGRKVVAYFTHDTMLEMIYCALGLYKEDSPLQGSKIDPNRVWRTSKIGVFSVNMLAVLNSCVEPGGRTYRVQIFINEKVTPICPLEGCTWQQFQDKFQPFANSSLDFCRMDYVHENDEPSTNSASFVKGFWNWY